MTWHLMASGNAATPDGETTSHRIETELLAELHAVLSKPKYGAVSSLLRGLHVVSTDLHAPGTPPADDSAQGAAKAVKGRGKTAPAPADGT